MPRELVVATVLQTSFAAILSLALNTCKILRAFYARGLKALRDNEVTLDEPTPKINKIREQKTPGPAQIPVESVKTNAHGSKRNDSI